MADDGKDEDPPPELEWSAPTTTISSSEYGVVGEKPTKRSGHTFTTAGTNAFMFGGIDEGKPVGPNNDMYILKIGASELEWSRADQDDDVPGPRWKHSACMVDEINLMIFGGFHSSTNRFNDVWYFNTVSMTWSQPMPDQTEFTPRGNHVPTKNMVPGAPSPRGGHSATVIGDQVWVFGGYGGLGYSRRDFDDLYTYSIEEVSWTRQQPKGTGPEKRSGHTACAVLKQLYIFGGWNSMDQFNDMFILDTEAMIWSQIAAPLCCDGFPRWNMAACSVVAIPHWKIFVFGGSSGKLTPDSSQGTYLNDVSVLDTGTNTWSRPNIIGDIPSPRAETQLGYDSKGSRLMIFGGWRNEWLGDIHSLNVGCVVGPPYAIMHIEPKVGPITGGVELLIEGIDFVNTKDVVVRFGCKKGVEDCPGTYVSETRLTCLTPDFQKFGPGIVEVRVALKGDSFTTTYQKYEFFAVSDCARCLAFGPGVLEGQAVGDTTMFVIQARDTENQPRTSGGDKFNIHIKSFAEEGKSLTPLIEDMENGQYIVTYQAPVAGEYEVAIEFEGTFGGVGGPIRGSPFLVNFSDNVSRDNNMMTGKLVSDKIREDIKELKQFTKVTNIGLSQEVDNPDWPPAKKLNALISVKEHLLQVELRQDGINYTIDRLHAMLDFLKQQGASLVQLHNNLGASETQWEEVQRKVPIVIQKLAPLVKAQTAATKVKIQEYEDALGAYKAEFMEAAFWEFESGVPVAQRSLDDVETAHKAELKKCEQMQHEAMMFECADKMGTSQEIMLGISKSLDHMRALWELAEEATLYMDIANSTPWEDVDGEALEEKAKELMMKCKKLHKEVKESAAFKGLNAMMVNLVITCPLVGLLRQPAMQRRHWQEVMQVTGKEIDVPEDNPELLLADVMSLELHKFKPAIEDVGDKAAKEAKQEQLLGSLNQMWSGCEWIMTPFRDTDENPPLIPLLKCNEDDFEQLEADQMAIQTMLTSRYQHFKKKFEAWSTELLMVNDVISLLADIQRNWSYLEPLFIGSEEVRRELPKDAERFSGIDRDVKQVLIDAWADKLVHKSCNKPGLLDKLEEISEHIELCKKSLSDFLNGKRTVFPRFYFTSEADLLDILSNGSIPEKILRHIDKVFLSTKTLELEGETDNSRGIRPTASKWISGVGVEAVSFEPATPLEGKVEIYLQVILTAKQKALTINMNRSRTRYPTQARTDWLMNKMNDKPTDPAQVVLLVALMYFTTAVEEAFETHAAGNQNAVKELSDRWKAQLKDLIKITRTELTKQERQRVMCMITLDAHSRDVLEKLDYESVSESSAFQWQSQLKQRWKNEDTVEANICDAVVPYSWEYLGNGSRLVVTPLTDRIYVTATQALNLKMGCAPAGPAGTGKTESTKDLASALGKVCYVFNCSPEMDYQSLGNIFKGLASSGAWGCFDEFNRLVPEVLSVCTVQFKAVCDGCKAFDPGQKNEVTIEGQSVNLDPSCGAFITMNPGYLGRSELPEGLKALFRPMTVMVPDLVMICENMMMAEGFETAKSLASKFFSLYQLLAALLSKQEHYDWGLRAIKSVLVVAGSFKRASPAASEADVLMRALRDFNTPKIVKRDEVVFFGLLGDLFPGCNPPRETDKHLEECVQKACEELSMWPDANFRLMVVRLEELLAIRHCVFIMGPPGAGKTECYRVLARARGLQFDKLKTKVVDLNPKAVSTEELYGVINLSTREWKDGLLSKVMRDLGQIDDEKPKWMILDGDLDANWIESMNSVMDDNRMLTLASNERIPLKSYMRMIFEIRDLKYATPATVSRAGILYISTDDGFQWNSLVCSWVASRPENWTPESKGALSDLFEYYIPTTLDFIQHSIKHVVPTVEITMVQALLSMFEGILEAAQPDITNFKLLETYFVFCTVWGMGSGLTLADDGTDYRKIFSDWWRKEWKQGRHGPAVKVGTRPSSTIFDFFYDKNTDKFEEWKNAAFFKAVEFDGSIPMANVFVPTPETCSINYWMEMLVNHKRPVMVSGASGTGKTAVINGLLNKLHSERDSTEFVHTTVNFNFYTNSTALQSIMEGTLVKKSGTTFGPPGKANAVYFIDDINLPEVDPYNTQTAIALLRQHIDYSHWYDKGKLTIKNIQNVQYIACMNPTAGCFFVNPRLQRHFVTFAMGMPSATSLLTIYQTFLEGYVQSHGFSMDVQSITANIIKSALALHNTVSVTFRKTAANFHYEFNIRHLTGVFQGLLSAQKEEFSEPDKFVRLWLHESWRVYGDRLVCAEDLESFKKLSQAQAKKQFPVVNVAKYFLAEKEHPEPLIFCHFPYSVDDQKYDQVLSMEKLREVLEGALKEHNEIYPVMDLVLFEDAMAHVCRIVRIIKQSAGHALLVGVGGSGKQSLARLGAFICQYTVMSILITGQYGIPDLKLDLQNMYSKAGLKAEGILFLFTDSQVSNERFLVYMNDLLASGNIPDLYAVDEQDTIVSAVLPKVKAAGLPLDKMSCWNFFLEQVRENLHVALCFSPVGDAFRTRAKKFPALVNCTVIDWFQPWPEEALTSVGKKFLDQVDVSWIDDEGQMVNAIDSSVRGGVERFMPYAFLTVNQASKQFLKVEHRYVYTTPKSFLECLILFGKLLKQKIADKNKAIERLAVGLQKMEDTEASVAILEDDIRLKLALAEEKKAESEEMAEKVLAEKVVVEAEKEKAALEKDKCDRIAEEVSVKQADAEADLAKAEPAVMAAMAALDTLNKKDLGNCKTMAKPPAGVDDVFGAVMVLMAGLHPNIVTQKNGKVKEKDRAWDACKKALLGNINAFIDDLKNYKQVVDAGDVPNMNWKEVRPFLAMEHFTVEVIEKKNSAAAGLCSWVVNIVMYYDIVVEVEPKRQLLKQANEQLADANAKLKIVQDKVDYLEAQFNKLQATFDECVRTAEEAASTAEKAKQKLELARRLTSALGSENERWHETVVLYKEERNLIIGDVILTSAFISYIGPFTKPFRDDLINRKWIPFLQKAKSGESIPMSDPCQPVLVLTNESQISTWKTLGLPSDSVSVENAAIAVSTQRWPLLIDPQLQGVSWVRNKEGKQKGRKLTIMRLPMNNDREREFEKAIEKGQSILIENMHESIEATLWPIVTRATFKKGNSMYVRLGEKELEWNPNFRLFLHTKLANPHYPPEIQAETTLVNFTVTPIGLEEQLLALVIKKEREDLATEKNALVHQQNQFKIKILDMEDDILGRLSSAEGDVTDDVDLIVSLEKTKKMSDDIKEKVKIAKKTELDINAVSEKYREVAARGALLFFLMNDLHKIHSFYIYSLNAFVVIFQRGIDLVSEAALNAAKAPKMKGGMLSRLKAAAKKVIETERFGWNQDVLQDSRMPAEGDMQGLAGKAKKKSKVSNMSDEEVHTRCLKLEGSITSVVFNYLRRGLFEPHKLVVATQLTLNILNANNEIDQKQLDQLLLNVPLEEPKSMGALSEWMNPQLWARLQAVEVNCKGKFEGLGAEMINESDEWHKWFDDPAPESLKLPGEGMTQELKSFEKMLILRALRPDRLNSALSDFVDEKMGVDYTPVGEKPFDMRSTYMEASASTPIFFVLFPGVDPTPWVEDLARKFDISFERGNFLNISMGQGQEKRAEETMKSFSENGSWCMLQNVHLMTAWLPTLERTLELCSEHADRNFRCFISAEAPPTPHMKSIPESLLQSCIKVANEAPADIKSNLRRAWSNFSGTTIANSSKPKEFKSCLFGLCFFHSVMLGRRKFGAQGWSRKYSFNTGDLVICANVLANYIDNNEEVPWDDLRYIFGEIMYGGHITDFWDRRTAITYLQVLFREDLFTGMELAPGFASPMLDSGPGFSYDEYAEYLETRLPKPSPTTFGLHPNAEIGYLTSSAEELFQIVVKLTDQPGGGGDDAEEGGAAEDEIGPEGTGPAAVVADLLSRVPRPFDTLTLAARAKPLLEGEQAPYVVVALQECTRMNTLLEEISRSLEELKKGFNGQLSMSLPMEHMAEALSINQVPGRNPFHKASWEKLAWFSKKPLATWFPDLCARVSLLQEWSSEMQLPYSLWLPGLFNPAAFLTAVKQVTARREKLPLDHMTVETHVSLLSSADDAASYPEDGAFVHGLFMEGARWAQGDEVAEQEPTIVGTTQTNGWLVDSRLKELLPPMPLIYIKAVETQPNWEPASVGFIRHDPKIYDCPVFFTTMRGPTYVFLATLTTKVNAAKWVLLGVALMMQESE
jgi:dynein heavy chain